MSQAGIFITGPNPSAPVETLTGNTGGAVGPTAGNINIVGGNAIFVVGDPGTSTLTIGVTGGGVTWNVINTNTQTVSNNGYIVTNTGSQSILLLPVAPIIGDIVKILAAGLGIGGPGGGSWLINQTGLIEQVQYANNFTTAGATGQTLCDSQNDYVELLYIGSSIWVALDLVGNVTFI